MTFRNELLTAIDRWPAPWSKTLPTGEDIFYDGPGPIEGLQIVRVHSAPHPENVRRTWSRAMYSTKLLRECAPDLLESIILRDAMRMDGEIRSRAES